MSARNELRVFYPFVLVLIVFSIGSCKKQSCECETFKNIPDSTKEWFLFKDSSRWVYRMAEDTTVFDTVTLLLSTNEFSNFTCKSEYNSSIPCSEMFILAYQHSNKELFPSNHMDPNTYGGIRLKVFSTSASIERFFLESDNKIVRPSGSLLDFPLQIGKKVRFYTLIDSTSFYEINSLKINSTTLYIKYTESFYLEDNMTDIWWSKGVGIVRYIKSEGKKPKATWELVEYNIKQ